MKKFDLKCTSLDSNKRDSRKIINLCTFLFLTHKTFLINKNSINSASIYNLWSWHLILSLRSCWEFFSSLFFPLKIAPNFRLIIKIYLRLKARFLVEFLNLCNFFIIHPYGLPLTSSSSSLSTFIVDNNIGWYVLWKERTSRKYIMDIDHKPEWL